MELQAGDALVLEQRGRVVRVLRDADGATGYEIAIQGAPDGETWLVPVEALTANTGPRLRKVEAETGQS